MNYSDSYFEGRSSVSWGAIFAGAVIAVAMQMMFMALGAGVGFSAFDPAQGDSVGSGTALTAGIFTFVTALVSVFAGGYVAGRLGAFRTRAVAALHGLCAWAVVTGFTALVIGSGVGSVLRAAGNVVGGTASTLAGVVTPSGGVDVNGQSVANEVRQLLKDTGKAELDPDRLNRQAKQLPSQAARAQARNENGAGTVESRIAPALNAMDRDAVANVLAKRVGITKAEALALIGQGEDKASELSVEARAQLDQVKAKALEAAQTGTAVAAKASWTTFFALFLGAIASLVGGMLGAPRRMYAESMEREELRAA